jgi:hypothetical protein
MQSDFDRYAQFRGEDGMTGLVPYIPIPAKPTDYYVQYSKGKTRLDVLSNDYYGDPNYGWLILQANPSAGSVEFRIKDGEVLRIPYPLDVTLVDYKTSISDYQKLNNR